MEYRHTQTAYKSALFVVVSLVVMVPIVMGLAALGRTPRLHSWRLLGLLSLRRLVG